MKQSFGKTLMSCFLTVTLMASVLAGAISVSCSSAKADTVSQSDVMYFDDVISSITNLGVFTQAQLDGFFGYVAPFVRDIEENSMYMVCVCHDTGTNNWAVQLFSCAATIYSYQFSSGGNTYHGLSSANGSAGSTKFRCRASLFTNGSNKNYIYYDASISVSDFLAKRTAINFDTVPGYQYVDWYGYPNAVDFAVSGRKFWISHDVTLGNDSWSASKNLFYGSIPTIAFDLVKFKLGERTYLTVNDQNIIFNMQPQDDDYLIWHLEFMSQDGFESDTKYLYYSDLTLIPGAENWLNAGLINVHSQGVLAFDITDLTYWHDIWFSELFWIYDPPTGDPSLWAPYAEASNVPFLLGDDPGGMSDSYTQAWNQFNTYVTNYNTTHVIPETLAETLFGVDGGKLYPVTVSEPSSVAATRNDGALVDGNLYTFQWSMTEPSNLGYNYDLFDVVIIPSNYAGYYGLVYFYDSSLNPPYQFVDRVSFDSLIDSFDCIIILPDDAGTLEDNTWWQQLVPSYMRGDMAVGGTSSNGIEYVDTVSGNEFQGFMIVTQKAIQKQQLWNFNDGITKLYKLEVDYIDSEDKWKDSFLLWSASIFDMLNSIDGHLNSILTSLTSLTSVIDQIKTTLDEIADDPDPDEVKPWYLSLWLFMKQFEPSNAQISEGLGYLVDNIDDIPLLPALTPVPALPTPGGG